MNARHQQFINEYIACHFNGSAAYKRVYPDVSDDTARVNASKLLTITNISEEIQRRIDENAMSANEVLSRLAEQARGAHGEYLSAFGVDLAQLIADRKGHLVKSVKQVQYGKDVEFYDAQAALVHLGRHHKLFTDKTEVSGELEIKDANEIASRLTGKLDSLAARISPPAATSGDSAE